MSSSISNGHDAITGQYLPRTNLFVCGRCDDINVRRNGLLMAERTCKTRKITREDYGPNEPIYYLVRYRYNSGSLTALMWMEHGALVVEYQP